MKIAVGKIGQKLIFDRTGIEANRSNINGNAVVSKFYEIIFENITEHDWYVVGDYDYIPLQYSNHVHHGELDGEYDLGIFFSGVIFENSDPCLKYINESGIKWYLLTEDKYCLPNTPKLKNLPKRIYGMSNDKVNIRGTEYKVKPYNIGASIAYKHSNKIQNVKDIDCILTMGNSNKDARYSELAPLIAKYNNIEIYGRENVCINANDKRYKGEVPYSEMIEIYKRSKSCICTPVYSGWYTGKIVECLMYNMIPIVTANYDYSAMFLDHGGERWDGYYPPVLFKIENKNDLETLFMLFNSEDNLLEYHIGLLKEHFKYDKWVSGEYIIDYFRVNIIHELR